MTTKAKAVLLSYARAAAASALALFINGNTDFKALAVAALAAVAGPALKALDPNSPEFGRGSK
jgi:hypothetical protein